MITLHHLHEDSYKLNVSKQKGRICFEMTHFHPAYGTSCITFKPTKRQLTEMASLINERLLG